MSVHCYQSFDLLSCLFCGLLRTKTTELELPLVPLRLQNCQGQLLCDQNGAESGVVSSCSACKGAFRQPIKLAERYSTCGRGYNCTSGRVFLFGQGNSHFS